MSDKTFAQRATDIMNKESDPALQKDLLEGLMQEQEKYKAENGLNEPKMSQDQFDGTGNSFLPLGDQSQYWYDTSAQNRANNYNLGQMSPGSFSGFDAGSTNPQQLSSGMADRWDNTGYDRQAFAADGGIGDGGNMLNFNQGRGVSNWFQNSPGAQNAAAFGMQMIPSAVSGIANFIGNKNMKDRAREMADKARDDYSLLDSPERIRATQIAPEKISLAQEREEARRGASDTKRATQQQLKSAAKTRGQYLSGAGTASAQTDKVLGNILGQSRGREAQMNMAERARAQQLNMQSLSQAKQFNAASENARDRFNAQQKQRGIENYYKWMQQANAYEQGQYGAVTGVMKDASNIAAQNQMISSLGDRYGYNRANWWAPNQYNINYQGRQS